MSKSMIFSIVLILIIVSGCASSGTVTFNQGVKRINGIDNKFDTGMNIVPNSTNEINELMAELIGFKALNKDMPLSLKYLLDFRIKSLEAELLHTEGWQWGRGSTTDWGFGCRKGSARILNSSKIRNASAQKGYEALDALKSFIEEFPNEAESAGLSQKDVLFLNAAYQQVEDKARVDARRIRSMCKEQIKELNITI